MSSTEGGRTFKGQGFRVYARERPPLTGARDLGLRGCGSGLRVQGVGLRVWSWVQSWVFGVTRKGGLLLQALAVARHRRCPVHAPTQACTIRHLSYIYTYIYIHIYIHIYIEREREEREIERERERERERARERESER